MLRGNGFLRFLVGEILIPCCTTFVREDVFPHRMGMREIEKARTAMFTYEATVEGGPRVMSSELMGRFLLLGREHLFTMTTPMDFQSGRH